MRVAHYTQFLVYDFDGDGKAEVAMKTAPGTRLTARVITLRKSVIRTKSEIPTTTKSYIGTADSGRLKGKNPFTQYLTIFDGAKQVPHFVLRTLFRMMRQNDQVIGATARQSITEVKDTLRQWLILTVFIRVSLWCRGYYHDSVIRAYTLGRY